MNSISEHVKRLEDLTKSDVLIVYMSVEPSKPFVLNTMANTVALLQTHIDSKAHDELTIILQGTGGDISPALGLLDYLRDYSTYKTLSFYVPNVALSSFTFLCMCGDKFYMRSESAVSDFFPVLTTAKTQKEIMTLMTDLFHDFERHMKKGQIVANPDEVIRNFIGFLAGQDIRQHGRHLNLETMKKLIGNKVEDLWQHPYYQNFFNVRKATCLKMKSDGLGAFAMYKDDTYFVNI